MKVHYEKEVANHSAPSHALSPVRADGVGNPHAWERSVDRGDAGRALEPRKQAFGVPTLLSEAEGNIEQRVFASVARTPRGRRPRARIEAPCARTGRSRGYPSSGGSRGKGHWS